MAVGLQVPLGTTNNAFSVIITADSPITGVDITDIRLRPQTSGGAITLTSQTASIRQIAGTDNWEISINLTGTFNEDFRVVMRAGVVTQGGQPAPSDRIQSAIWRVDSSYVPPLSIESIDEQFVFFGTEDYSLIIDIGGNPDTVDATGHMEGFDSHWDAAMGQLHIRAAEVTRLISGVFWNVDVRRGVERLMSAIGYNVIKAPPIFETLPMIHLYRGVPINFDIVIQNIPDLIVPNARLLGIKSELLEHGLNFGGQIPADSIFSFNTGNVMLIVPSDTGETSDMQNYPYVIEAGAPPAIGTPEFIPSGNFGVLEVSDVMHALGYEWTLDPLDTPEPSWNSFSDARPVIDLRELEVTPGDLDVTIKFPNITGASSYEYSLESETHNRDWTAFTGTLSNGFITTIIPDLQDGVEYTLRLRVASPWIGSPVSVTVFGGRLIYLLPTGGPIFISHTGVAAGNVMPVIKRVLLPSEISTNVRGITIEDDIVYVLAITNDTVYVLGDLTGLSDNQTATIARRFQVPTVLTNPVGLAIQNGVLFSAELGNTREVASFLANTPDNTRADLINDYNLQDANSLHLSDNRVAVDGDVLFFTHRISQGVYTRFFPIAPADFNSVRASGNLLYRVSFEPDGVESIDNKVYLGHGNELHIFPFQDLDIFSTDERIKTIRVPIALSNMMQDISIPK